MFTLLVQCSTCNLELTGDIMPSQNDDQGKFMGFWDAFKNLTSNDSKDPYHSGLHSKAKVIFPDGSEEDLITWTCIAGLLARVAYADLKIQPKEKDHMITALETWTDFGREKSEKLATLAIDEIQTLSGAENHRYCYALNDRMDNDNRYHLLEALFALAASDGGVASVETEEIRNITKALLLEHKHFISAKATVLDKLQSLKG
ncbi:MAG: TerB family tellurite resistance protein [Bacteriovoracaceae bacterium]